MQANTALHHSSLPIATMWFVNHSKESNGLSSPYIARATHFTGSRPSYFGPGGSVSNTEKRNT